MPPLHWLSLLEKHSAAGLKATYQKRIFGKKKENLQKIRKTLAAAVARRVATGGTRLARAGRRAPCQPAPSLRRLRLAPGGSLRTLQRR